jgi:hypothetical protein
MSVEIEEMLRRYGQQLDRLAPLPTAAEVRARAEQLAAGDGAAGATTGPDGARREPGYLVEPEVHQMVALARPHTHRRRAIAVLATAAAVIGVTVAVAVTRPGTRPRPKPAAPPHVPPALSQPQLYWQNGTGIGRANLDGTGDVELINQPAPDTCGLTVDRNYVYWTDVVSGTVLRAKRDGTGIDTRFIVASGNGPPPPLPYSPLCVAVDGAHVYWTTQVSIGRANLDGTGVQKSFIPGVNAGATTSAACGLAVDRTHIYWANGAKGTIGRANLDGTGATQDFIVTGARFAVCGLVLDGAHIYWGTSSFSDLGNNLPTDGTIGRANLDGTGVNNSFITQPGVSFPVPCAEDGIFLYWTSGLGMPDRSGDSSNRIGRATLDGTDVRPDFLRSFGPPESGPGCAIGPQGRS